MRRFYLTFTAIVVALSACAFTPPLPRATSSVGFDTLGASFLVGKEGARYSMAYAVKYSFQDPVLADVHFENPLGGEDIVVTTVLEPGQKVLHVMSPDLSALSTSKLYRTVLYIYPDDKKERYITSHQQYVRALFSKEMLTGLNVRVVR